MCGYLFLKRTPEVIALEKLRILLVDDHTVLREGLALLINSQPDMEVVRQAGDGEDAVRAAHDGNPDVVVMDISMPNLNGIQATRKIRQTIPAARVLALTRHNDSSYLRQMIEAGASGYVLKKTAAQELILALRTVAAGRTYYDQELAGRFVGSFVGGYRQAVRPQPELSDREADVLRYVAWGYSNKEVAAKLGISVKTVEYYRARVAEKLNLQDRAEMVKYALRQGWLHDN